MKLTIKKPYDRRTPDELSDSLIYDKKLESNDVSEILSAKDFIGFYDNNSVVCLYIDGNNKDLVHPYIEKLPLSIYMKKHSGFEITNIITDERFLENDECKYWLGYFASQQKNVQEDIAYDSKGDAIMYKNETLIYRAYDYVWFRIDEHKDADIFKIVNNKWEKIDDENNGIIYVYLINS